MAPKGRPDPFRSRWFSEEITPEDFRWMFQEGWEGIKSYRHARGVSDAPGGPCFLSHGARGAQRTQLAVIPSCTDNKGNGALLNKLMSGKYDVQGFAQMSSGRHERRTARQTVSQTGTPQDSPLHSVFGFLWRVEVGSSSTRPWNLERWWSWRRRSTEQSLDGSNRSSASGRAEEA